MSDPLANEEIWVYVELEHVPTSTIAGASALAPTDIPPTLAQAADEALEKAKAKLLERLEVQGGG